MPGWWIDPRTYELVGRQWTQDELVKQLATELGPAYAGTTKQANYGALVYDGALSSLDLEDDGWKGASIRAWVGSSWQDRGIVGYTSASTCFAVSPAFASTLPLGSRYEVFVAVPPALLRASINRAIEDAAPEIYEQRIAKLELNQEQTVYIVPETADDIIGVEVSPILEGYPFQRIPRDRYEVQRVSPEFYATAVEPSGLQLAFTQQSHGAGQYARVHFKRYYRPLYNATASTRLDAGYILAAAEAYARRAIVGSERGSSLTRHHTELMVDAREAAEARKAALVANILGAPSVQRQGRKR